MTQRMHTIPGRIRLTSTEALWHGPVLGTTRRSGEAEPTTRPGRRRGARMAKSGSKEQIGLQAAPAAAPVAQGNGHPSVARAVRRGKGLPIKPPVTREGATPPDGIDEGEWTPRPAKISRPDGQVVLKI